MEAMKVKSVKYNFIMNVILTASTFIFPLITFKYVSVILLPAGVGKVNFATSVVSYFTMIAMLGVPTYGIRACAQVRDDRKELSRTVQEILIINLAVCAVTYLAFFLAVWNVPRFRTDAVLLWIIGVNIFLNVIGVEWLYKGLEQYSYITIRSIIFKAIALILMFFMVKNQDDYLIYGALSVVAGAGSNILNFLNLRKFVDLKPIGNYNFKRHLKVVAIFFLMSVATTIYTNLDTVMLGFMKNDTEVGYYSAAVKVKTILVSFVTALSGVLLPRVSYYIEHEMKEEFVRVGRKALNFVAWIAVPLVVYFTIYARESVLLLSAESFEGAIVPMQIIMPTVLLIGITNVLGIQILVPLGKEKMVFYSVLAGGIVDFVINILCIPTMASAGAALGTLIAEAVVLVVQVIILRRQIGALASGIRWFKIVTATVAAAFVCYWVKKLAISNILVLAVSVCVFFAVYGIVLLILKEDFSATMLKEMLCKLPKIKEKKNE